MDNRNRKRKEYLKLASPCGLDCFNCPGYLANTDEELRKFVAMRAQTAIENAHCEGCRPQKGVIKLFKATEPCQVYKCLTQKAAEYAMKMTTADELNVKGRDKRDKKFEFCFDCDEFPCEKLKPCADQSKYSPHNLKVYNLCLIKKFGLEKWYEEYANEIRKSYFNGKLDI